MPSVNTALSSCSAGGSGLAGCPLPGLGWARGCSGEPLLLGAALTGCLFRSPRPCLPQGGSCSSGECRHCTARVTRAPHVPPRPPFLAVPLCDHSCWGCHPSSSSVGKSPSIAYPKSKQFCLPYYKYHVKDIHRKINFLWTARRRNKRS